MGNKKQNDLDAHLETIAILKDAKRSWPAGFTNEPIRILLQKMEKDLQDKVFEILNNKRAKKNK